MTKNLILFMLFLSSVYAKAQTTDKFADIANKGVGTRLNLLIYPQPSVLPAIYLPATNKPGASFKPMQKIDNAVKLKQELLLKRQEYQEYLKDYAPKMQVKRKRIVLEDFDWRVETAEDRQNFSTVLEGKGKWEKVKVPHYGPPLGKAVTYYKTTLDVNAEMISKGSLFVHFNGVDYKAKVYVNKYMVGSNEGSFISFEFNIISHVKVGKNDLLVLVENDYPMQGHVGDDGRKFDGDKVYAATGMGYDDPNLGWHHNPPGMGINQTVYLEARDVMHFTDIFIRPLDNLDSAEVWLEINNTSKDYHTIEVKHAIYGQNFNQKVYENQIYEPVTIQIPGVGDLVKSNNWQKRTLEMGMGKNFLKFRVAIPNAKKWSLKTPWLYQLQVQIIDGDKVYDTDSQQFGMRTFNMDTISIPKGKMFLNKEPIKLRGANTMGNFMQDVKKGDYQQLIDDILLAKIANINYLRMTQLPVQNEVYDYCDRLGILTQTDLPLFGVLRQNLFAECIRQSYEMEKLVRKHPCNVMVSYINERFPNAEGNPQRHFSSYEDFRKFFLAADQAVLTANPDRVIKAGDGDYDPPSPGLPDNHNYNMWYNGHGLSIGKMMNGYWLPVKPNWYFACGEFGAEALDPVNTMFKYYPKEWLPKDANSLWAPDKIAQSQSYKFHYMWYDTQNTMNGWVKASQEHQEQAIRLTSEAFRRENRMMSFAIHLFIDAWPAGWMKTIMDVDRQPKPAYFAYKEALTPLAIQVKTDQYQVFSGKIVRPEIWICNDENSFPEGAYIKYQAEQNGKVLWANIVKAKSVINASSFQGYINWKTPKVKQKKLITFRAAIFNINNKPLHETTTDIEVYPEAQPLIQKIFTYADNPKAKQLIKELQIEPTLQITTAKIIILDNMDSYYQNQNELDSLVDSGKQLIFLDIKAGNYKIAGGDVKFANPSMGSYYFVSNATNHPIAKLFEEEDFKFLYHHQEKMIAPIIHTLLYAKNWTPILTSGNSGWTISGESAQALAEKKYGNGIFRILQLDLLNKTQDNPPAYQLLQTLLKW